MEPKENELLLKFTDLEIPSRFHIRDRYGDSHFIKVSKTMARCVNSSNEYKYLDFCEYRFVTMSKVLTYKGQTF